MNRMLSFVAAVGLLFALAGTGSAEFMAGDIVLSDNIRILRVDSVTGAQEVVSSGGLLIGNTRGIAISGSGDILVANSLDVGRIVRVDAKTGAQSLLSAGGLLSQPTGIAIGSDGGIFVSDIDSHSVIRINPSNGSQSLVSAGDLSFLPFGIALDTKGNIFVTDFGTDRVVRVDPATGAQLTISSGGFFADPRGIAIDGMGDILVADLQAFGPNPLDGPGGIIRVNPVTGDQSVVSSAGLFLDPWGITIDAAGQLLVADRSTFPDFRGAVFRVDPLTGTQATVSSGGQFADPTGIAVFPATVPEPSSLLLLSLGTAALLGCGWRRRERVP